MTTAARQLRGDGTRAAYPDDSGYVEREGVRSYWEVYGQGEPTVFFLPTWSLVHSRIWKAQVAYFARHFRVLLMDGRGNGHSDRPAEPDAYQPWEFSNDALAVMDATGTEQAVLVSTSMGTMWNLILCAGSPDRVLGSCFIGPAPYAATDDFLPWMLTPFNERLDSYEGWNRHNRHFIREHFEEFAKYWIEACVPEPHSTRPAEFSVDMCLDTTPEVVLATLDCAGLDTVHCVADTLKLGREPFQALAQQVKCPTLVVNGGLELVCPQSWADALARDTGGESLLMPDAGHSPQGRKPVEFNLALRKFVERVAST